MCSAFRHCCTTIAIEGVKRKDIRLDNDLDCSDSLQYDTIFLHSQLPAKNNHVAAELNRLKHAVLPKMVVPIVTSFLFSKECRLLCAEGPHSSRSFSSCAGRSHPPRTLHRNHSSAQIKGQVFIPGMFRPPLHFTSPLPSISSNLSLYHYTLHSNVCIIQIRPP